MNTVISTICILLKCTTIDSTSVIQRVENASIEVVQVARIDYNQLKSIANDYTYTKENLINYWVELGEDVDHWSHIVNFESSWDLEALNAFGYYGLFQMGITADKACPSYWRNNYRSQADCAILIRNNRQALGVNGWTEWDVNIFYSN